MSLEWIHEPAARWDADKKRIIGGAPEGVFDRRFKDCATGDTLPGDWWRVEADGRTVGYGWLDVVWGDGEILLAVDPEARGRGVGTFVLRHLEAEASRRGLNYVYNTVRPTHPDKRGITAWLERRGFACSADGSLLRAASSGPR